MLRSSTLSATLLLGLSASACTKAPEPWALGTRYTYGAHMASSASSLGSSSPMFDFDMSGQLDVTPVRLEDDKVQLLVAFKSASFTTTQAAATKARFEKIARELSSPHVFTFAAGRQVDTLLPNGEEAVTVAIMRNVAASFQHPMPLSGDAPQRVREYDATGRYIAEYKPLTQDDQGQRTFARRKLRYETLIADARIRTKLSATTTPMPSIHASRGQATYRGDVLLDLRAEEEVRLELVAGQHLVTGTSLELSLRARAKADEVSLATLQQGGKPLKADAPYEHASTAFDLDQAKIAGRTLEELVSEAAGFARQAAADQQIVATRNGVASSAADIERGKASTGRSLRHFVALAAVLRQEPGAPERAEAFVRSGSPAVPVLLSSLGAAGTEASQGVLRRLWQDPRLPKETQRMAGFNLIRAKHPSVASAELLESLLQDEHKQEFAELGLGTYVRLFGESGQSVAQKRFGEALLLHLAAASSSDARVAALLAISNSAYLPALTAVRRYFSDSDAEVRSAAIQSARLMQGPEVDAAILRVAAGDAETTVRRSALQALNGRSYSAALARAVRERLSTDTDPKVRVDAVGLLERWATTDRSLLASLEQAAKADESITVREEASSALARLRAASPGRQG